MMRIVLVRFKKNFRIQDHPALWQACQSGFPVWGIYAREPTIIGNPDYSSFHTKAICDSIEQLLPQLDQLGIPLLHFHQDMITTLDTIQQYATIQAIYSQEETGSGTSYQRDLDVIDYCKTQGITLNEYPTNGVVRRLSSRDDRHRLWKERILGPLTPTPICTHHESTPPSSLHTHVTTPAHISQRRERYSADQHEASQHNIICSGEQHAHQVLHSFLEKRSRSYMYHIGRPHESAHSCSRLSTYLTYGNISLRQVYQTTQAYSKKLADQYRAGDKKDKALGSHLRMLRGFTSRLHRHCHFIQKLEDQPDIEWKNMHPGYDNIRQQTNKEYLQAFFTGNTGIPYIDACIRCLQHTGRLHFRGRACLVSFMSNTLLQPWQAYAPTLAQRFIDYEPGIHYSQIQMQSGTTGINSIRIYNPIKQSQEKDDETKFLDTWIPELQSLPNAYKHEPWNMGPLEELHYGISLGIDYPRPIVDVLEANRHARDILYSFKKQPEIKRIAQEVYLKHGSRKNSRKKSKK